MRIATGGIHIESCTFSPQLSREEDFTILRGSSLLASYPFLKSYPDVTVAPLLYARALPGGPVERQFYERAKQEFLDGLKDNGPFDGLFLHLHGAMSVDGMADAEGDFLSAVRGMVGKECFLAASYDLHGNVSAQVMDCLDLLSAYRTAPHVDVPETLARVFGLLVKCLKEKIRPFKTFIPVPVLFSGERTGTEWEPAAGLYRKIPDVISGEDVLDASVLIGYVWADEERSSASVVAYGMDREKVRAAAAHLAEHFWSVRASFAFGVPAAGVDRCLQLAGQSSLKPVVISDSGDNPTAGGAGDSPYVLERMLALGIRDAVFASIADLRSVMQCEAVGSGHEVQLSLGGKLDSIHAGPISVNARVVSLHVLPWTLARQAGNQILNRIAVVNVQGNLVILTERRTTFHRIQDFLDLGIDPYSHPIVVVKIGYLEPELKKLAASALLALSPGAVDQDTLHIPYQKIRRPMYPFDADMTWSPAIR